MVERVKLKRKSPSRNRVRHTPEARARAEARLKAKEKPKPKAKEKRKPPNRRLLTEDNVLTLPARRKQYLTHDAGTGAARGLAVLVSPLGTKSYRCVFYFRGSPKPYWMHLGRVGAMTLEEAREATRKAQRLARPPDPDTPPQDPRAAKPTNSGTFESVLEDYTKHKQKGKVSALKTQRAVLHHTKDWHTRPIATIRIDEIELLLWRVRDGDEDKGIKPRPAMANRLHAHLHHLFDWAARNGGPLKESPMAGMEKPVDQKKLKPRDLDWFKGKAADAAIKAIWRAANDIGGNEGRYLKVLLLTGKRPWGRDNNVGLGALRWEHVDDDWFWDAPASKAENKRLHGVPLSESAQRVLGRRKKSGFVFDAIVDNDATKLIAEVRKRTGIEDFILHGIRHLVETKTAQLGVPPHIRDVLFDHAAKRGSGKGYDHHQYKSEMRDAMEAWAGYIAELVPPDDASADNEPDDGSNVVYIEGRPVPVERRRRRRLTMPKGVARLR